MSNAADKSSNSRVVGSLCAKESWTSFLLDRETNGHENNFSLGSELVALFRIYNILENCLFGVLRRFQYCTGHITTGSWKGRENQYIEFARVLYCKMPTNGKQLLAFPLQAITGIEPQPQRWEARVLPLCHHGPQHFEKGSLVSKWGYPDFHFYIKIVMRISLKI